MPVCVCIIWHLTTYLGAIFRVSGDLFRIHLWAPFFMVLRIDLGSGIGPVLSSFLGHLFDFTLADVWLRFGFMLGSF